MTFFCVASQLFRLHVHVRDVHSQHVYLQEESLPGGLRVKKTLQKFVLVIFYLQLINNSHADSSMQTKTMVSFHFEDKHVVNEHYVIQKNHDATQEKCHRMVHFNVPHDWFEQICSIKKVTLKVAKKL